MSMARRRLPRLRGDIPRTSPHFFKVLLGDFRQKLKIPPNFVKHISSEASRRATLQGPNGSNWHVDIIKTDKGAFFSRGWSKFVDDQSLMEFEFLVFQYNGSMHFTVLIFDTTACLREDLFTHKFCKRAKLSEGKKQLDRLMKHNMDAACLRQPQDCKLEPDLHDGKHSTKWLQDYSPDAAQGSYLFSSGDTDFIKKEPELPNCKENTNSKLPKGYHSRRRPVTEEERSRAKEAAKLFMSAFPHVMVRMTSTIVYKNFMMRFPPSFSRIHLPRKRANLVLRDPNGEAWVVTYIADTRDRLSAGWSSFSRGNNLEEGDWCAFELVGPVELRVHIFRVVEVSTPLLRIP